VTIRFTGAYALLFTVLAFANRYDRWLELPPASIHQWRQADGAAIAWHYAQEPDFSNVRICNAFHTGDEHAVGELPLLYWLSGLIAHNRGYPAQPLRWIGLLLLFLGGWAFGWVLLRRTRHPAVAALGAGLLLSSPVLAYYGPGFLPDAPAFCCILLMSACLVRAGERQSVAWLGAAALAAALAILLKLSMALVPLALALTWALGKSTRQWPGASFWGGCRPFFAIAGTVLCVVAGRGWISWYNGLHHAFYFLASTRPVWRYDLPFIGKTTVLAAKMALPVFASAGLYVAVLGSLWLAWKQRKQASFADRNILAFTGLGCAAYILLWFRMFREHDYYLICLLAVPALLLLHGICLARTRFSEKRLIIALGVCWLLGLWHSHHILSKRLYLAFHPETSQNLPPAAFLPSDALAEAGIPVASRVLCPQDPSPNIALLALRRHGWSGYNFSDRVNADTLLKYQTHFGLTHLALRDTAFYSPLYRAFFPERVFAGAGWYVYGRK